jgi:hypothetical protein
MTDEYQMRNYTATLTLRVHDVAPPKYKGGLAKFTITMGKPKLYRSLRVLLANLVTQTLDFAMITDPQIPPELMKAELDAAIQYLQCITFEAGETSEVEKE